MKRYIKLNEKDRNNWNIKEKQMINQNKLNDKIIK